MTHDDLNGRVPVTTYLARLTPVTMVYLGAAWIGLQYASVASSISLVWPATGIAIAALVLFGPRYWPGIALGAFLANATTEVPLIAAIVIAAGNTLEAVVAAWVLRRRTGSRPQLDDVGHVRALVLVAAPLGAAISAVVGVGALVATGALAVSAAPLSAGMWWAGDLLGAFVIAPLFFTSRTGPFRTPRRKFVEATLLCLGTALAVQLSVAEGRLGSLLQQVDYHYLLFPFVIWAALRFGARGAAAMTLTVSAVSVWRALHTGEPFGGTSSNATLLGVASYLAVVAVTGLLLAASLRWERDKAARALQQSEERLRLAVDAARMGIWYWSVDGNELSWDENLRALYGLEPGAPVNGYAGFLERVHPDDRDWVNTTVQQALESGDRLAYEFRILWPDGTVRWIADQSRVARDESGRALYMTGVCMDATDRRRGEERLRQAHRMDSLGRLAGGVAHEANNQMSVVLGAAHFVLRRQDLPADVRTDVEYIRKAAERTAAVTAQLLAFSRRQLMMPVLLDVNAVIRGWEPVLRRLMGEDCPVRLELGSDVPSVRADPGQLEQVLLNLALNARDAMPQGGTLVIETGTLDIADTYSPERPGVPVRPGSYALVAVRDVGHGMDRNTLAHVFEPFFTTKPVGQGTGLGLATVYGIVKQSNGYVWAQSEPGVGTTFKVCLPVAGETAELEDILPEPAATRRSGERIFIVEDEAAVRAIMRRTLEEAGYEVQEAASGTEALERLAAGDAVDLLITDLVMPEMGGRDLAAAVLEQHPRTSVLFISGYTDRDIARRGHLPVGAAFLQKPVAPESLVTAVRESLDRATARS